MFSSFRKYVITMYDIQPFAIHSSIDRHLVCLHLLAIKNNAAMNIFAMNFFFVCVWIYTFIYLGYIKLLSHMWILWITIWGLPDNFLKRLSFLTLWLAVYCFFSSHVQLRFGPERKLSTEELMLSNCDTGEDSWNSLGLQGNQTSQSQMKSTLTVHCKGWCWSWSSNTLATWCEELTHWKRPWCWEGLKAKGEEGDRVWDGWNGQITSLTQWTWIWANSGR